MSRERFEQQFKGMPYRLSMQKDLEGDYTSYATKMAWEGWIAAMSYCMQVLLDEEMCLQQEGLSAWLDDDGEAFRRKVCNKLFEEHSPFWKG